MEVTIRPISKAPHERQNTGDKQVLSINHDGIATLTCWEHGGGGLATFHFDQGDGLIPALKAAIEAYEASK